MEIVALSGGKDSTALALRLKELNPETDYTYVCTPTGDELPEMVAHWIKLERLLGQPLVYLRHPKTLNEAVEHMNAIPNWRQRWCTRILKIQVIQKLYLDNPGSTVYVGLRADEEARKGGVYDGLVDVLQVYPMREWGWTKSDVWAYLCKRGVTIPARTDCARCFFQRIGEWWLLWKNYPAIWADIEQQEERIGYTWRSPGRDTWPAALKDLRKEFEAGRRPRTVDDEGNEKQSKCRVCSL